MREGEFAGIEPVHENIEVDIQLRARALFQFSKRAASEAAKFGCGAALPLARRETLNPARMFTERLTL